MDSERISHWAEFQDHDDSKPVTVLFVDYYQRPFMLFHDQLIREGYLNDNIHPIREQFWGLLPKRTYEPLESRPLIQSYIGAIKQQLAQIISEHSIGYWLHLYRRLAPGPIGRDKAHLTIGETRATLEAAIQKYSTKKPCSGIGRTGQIPLDRVLGGLLMSPEFALEREVLQSNDQLVLTDFTSTNLLDFYEIEKLAYEMWRSNAMSRIVGKGAPIIVDDAPEFVFDSRSDELDKLVKNYDSRIGRLDYTLSSTGLVSKSSLIDEDLLAMIILPIYNLTSQKIIDLEPVFTALNLDISSYSANMVTNFLWLPKPIRQYRDAHIPFAKAFRAKHKVDLDPVLLIIAALCFRVMYVNAETKGHSIFRYWQRAYEGPYKKDYILNEIMGFLSAGGNILGISDTNISEKAIKKAFRFWEFDKNKRILIGVGFPGPHSIFLPYGNDRFFIDYAWINWQLYYLFTGINIPDQNFKGDALEYLIRTEQSVLPVRGCKLANGGKKQVDAAFRNDNQLIIVECKVFGKSIGFYRGDPQSIRYRNERINKALSDVDEKARWLANNPIGTNFDISSFSEIIPVVVTPFVEYIYCLDQRFWLKDGIPRVLSPIEFKRALDNNEFSDVVDNIFSITVDHQ